LTGNTLQLRSTQFGVDASAHPWRRSPARRSVGGDAAHDHLPRSPATTRPDDPIGDGGAARLDHPRVPAHPGWLAPGEVSLPFFELDGSPSLLALSGELDMASAPVLAEVLEPLTTTGAIIQLDLTGLTFIDAAGIEVLCRAVQRLGPQGRLLAFAPRPAVRRTMELTGLDGLIEIVDDRGAAGSPGVAARPDGSVR
jgi:anti-sigma B factor antagonist